MDKFFTEGTYMLSNYCLICFEGEYDKAYDLLQGQVLSDVGLCKEKNLNYLLCVTRKALFGRFLYLIE